MTPIYDTNDVPLRLHINQQFAVHQQEDTGFVLHMLREKNARFLAQKILENEKFFDLKIERGYGELQSSVIVMTEKEYADKLQSQFKAGALHALEALKTHVPHYPIQRCKEVLHG